MKLGVVLSRYYPIIGHSFHRLLIRYLRWARSAAPLRLNAQQKAYNIATTAVGTTAKVEIVPPTDVEGMRKVKHLTVSLTTAGEDTSER